MMHKKLSVLILMSTLFACRTTDKSRVKQETDDRTTPVTAKLVDMSSELNSYVNQQLQAARKTVNPSNVPWSTTLKDALIAEVFKRMGKAKPGTGVGVHFQGFNLEVSTLTEIEAYLIDTFKVEAQQIHFTKFIDSLYGDNPVGLTTALVISHSTMYTADHSIAPVIRVAGSLIGLDKLGHFTAQGHWYFRGEQKGLLKGETERLQFGQFMEGIPDLSPDLYPKYKSVYGEFCKTCVVMGGFGYFGMVSTGVASTADINANEDGYQFFVSLYENPGDYKFDIRNYDVSRWNESQTKNYYKEGFKIRPVP